MRRFSTVHARSCTDGSSRAVVYVELAGTRLLVASPLGRIIESRLRDEDPLGLVVVAADEQQVREAVARNLRFDVVLADLMWNDTAVEDTFDGLDVLDLLVDLNRLAPVVFAAQGHRAELDHLAEARARDGVSGVIPKAAGYDAVLASVLKVAEGGDLPNPPGTIKQPTLFEYFSSGRRGLTTARLAGAIASRRASNNETLVTVTGLSRNTTTKIAELYVGPLMRARGERDRDGSLTVQSVYRWCGVHAPYIMSWCRRNGQADVL